MARASRLSGIAAYLLEQLDAIRRSYRRSPTPSGERRHRATLAELLMFAYAGHPQNLYTQTGIPRTHNAWEMQYLLDGGLLFLLYERCGEIVRASAGAAELQARVEALVAELAVEQHELLAHAREHYASGIAEFLTQHRALRIAHSLRATLAFECVVIQAYLRLAVASEGAIITLDLFPAHTGPENVVEGLRGLVPVSVTGTKHRRARRFHCRRAETYVRYYGLNLARELAARTGADGLRFALVVPSANGVRHIALTRCWPIDGAENIARYVAAIAAAWTEAQRRRPDAPPNARLLICGYSQGGAAVRLFDDALGGVDVLARAYFKQAAPRQYLRRARTLAQLCAGEWATKIPFALYTVSIATMGGIDGIGFAERLPELPELAADQRGAAGLRARANPHAGLHLAICHDFDPARRIVPASLIPRRERKLSLIQILRKFGGPNLVFHGGVWTRDTERSFADNPPARALIDHVLASLVSDRFVDERHYFDERCTRAAFPHLVVGTHGYPGWVVVAKFGAALRELDARRAGSVDPHESRAVLLREPSWRCDILPADHDYEQIIAAAARFHEAQRRRAEALLARLDASLAATLREQLDEQATRVHLLREHD